MTRGRIAVAVSFGLAALAAGGCAPGDDDPHGPGDTGLDRWDGAVEIADVPDVAPDDGGGVPDIDPSDVDGSLLDHVCGEEDFPMEYDIDSEVLIVLDRSGSMMLTLGPLKNAVNAIVGASDDRIGFGLMPFPSSIAPNACALVNPFTECAAPERPQVEVGAHHAAAIAAALEPIRICGSTPTAVTLRNAHTYLHALPPGRTRYVLLATDGVPNCNDALDGATCVCMNTDTGCVENPGACLDDAATYAAIDALSAEGIKTYVLAMGSWSGTSRDVLDAMAVHGGTGHFYPAERPEEILTVFEAIMGTIVVSCRFDLHPGDEVDPTQVNLYVGGEVVPRDASHGDGWDYIDEDTVEFYGPACDRILSGEIGDVGAAYGCPTVLL
jgi:hypothetical protein